jgi:hypothetical protein
VTFRKISKSLLFLLFPFFLHAENFDTGGILVAVDKQILSIRNNDLQTAYFKLTTSNYRKHTSFQEFKTFVESLTPLKENAAIHLGCCLIHGEIGVYEGTVVSKDGQEMEIHYELLKHKQKWRINSMILLRAAPTSIEPSLQAKKGKKRSLSFS